MVDGRSRGIVRTDPLPKPGVVRLVFFSTMTVMCRFGLSV